MLRVGELARRSGLSVRTLRYYDEIGLLRPGDRTGGGHRVYSVAEVSRLQQIRSLQQLGLSLADIGACLDQPGFSLAQAVQMQLGQLREQMRGLRRLRDRLEAVARLLRQDRAPSIAQLTETMEMMKQLESYYTPEQLEQLARRREELGSEGMEQAQREWTDLIGQVRALIEAGADPAGEEAQMLAAMWQDKVAEFTGGDSGIAASLGDMYRDRPDTWERFGIDADMRTFIGKAMAAAHPGS